jgi:hypothetical protein
VAALIVAIVALLGVLGVGAFAVVTVLGSGGGPLTGRLPAVTPGAPLPGTALEKEVSARVGEDGGQVGRVTCPETRTIAQGAVTVCHASVDGADWAIVVFFEDAQGTYTLSPV